MEKYSILNLEMVLNMCQIPNMSGSEYSRIINMPGFWISMVAQGLPIFVSRSGFWIWVGMQLEMGSEYSRIPTCQFSAYAWIWLNALINRSDYGRVLNRPGQSFTGFWTYLQFLIWQASEYGKVVNIRGLYSLNMP